MADKSLTICGTLTVSAGVASLAKEDTCNDEERTEEERWRVEAGTENNVGPRLKSSARTRKAFISIKSFFCFGQFLMYTSSEDNSDT